MIVEPKVREFICTTAHPTGCAENVKRQIAYVQSKGKIDGPKKVLVIGASTGYGLASRITAAFGSGADTIGVMYEKAASGKRTATQGWYNTAAFEEEAGKAGLAAKSVNGDAFSKEIKEQTIELIKNTFGQADMVIYSLAAPRRITEEGITYQSVLKTTADVFTEKSLDLKNNTIVEKSIYAANEEEIESTVKVMGGEDWKDWITALNDAGVLKDGAVTMSYSYIGPKLTYPVYFNGTIGLAKKHLAKTAEEINSEFPNVKAYISVNKALVTQASSAIPIVPLYFAILYKVMKEEGKHEGCIEQITRLFQEKLPEGKTDEEGMIRLDDWEMEPVVQERVMEYWNRITSDNVEELSDLKGYWEDFYHMFGFGFDNVDYTKDVEVDVIIGSMK